METKTNKQKETQKKPSKATNIYNYVTFLNLFQHFKHTCLPI